MPNKKGTRKNKGEGNIRKRADGLLEARVTLGYKDGKRIQKSVYAKTEEEIVSKKNKLLAQYGMGILTAPDKLTVQQMLLDWLEHKFSTVKVTTYEGYKGICERHIFPRVGSILVQKLEPEHLEQMYRAMKREGYAKNYIRLAHVCVRDALERLRRRKRIAENVATLVESLPRDDTPFESVVWTAEQAQHFIDFVKHDRMFALYWLALTGAMRRGELLALKWNNVTLEHHSKLGSYVVINIRANRTQANAKVYELEPKTHRSKRPVILPYEAWEVLQAHKAKMEGERSELAKRGYTAPDEGYVFLSPFLEPWHPSNFYNRSWLALLKAAKLPPIRFHDLRHSNITLDLSTGGDLKTASQRAGHSNISITGNIYQHPNLEQHLEATSRIAELIKPQTKKMRLN